MDEPVVGAKGQAEAENVFEDQKARERFDGNVSWKIASATIT